MNSRPKKLPSTENDVKAIIADWFTNQGGKSWAIVAGPRGVHGIADRIGVLPVVVTPEMVGKTVGLFVAIEAKKPGRRGEARAGATQAQVDFLADVIRLHGVGAMVDCALDLGHVAAALCALRTGPYDIDHYATLRQRLLMRVTGEEA